MRYDSTIVARVMCILSLILSSTLTYVYMMYYWMGALYVLLYNSVFPLPLLTALPIAISPHLLP